MMTESPWQSQAPQVPPAGQNTAGYESGAPSAAAAAAESKANAAKEETSGVARHAAGAAQDVAETAKTEVANVASEVKSSTMDLLHQAKSDLTAQAGTQQQKAAEGIRKISDELRTMAGASEEQGVAADIVRQAADRSASVASWLENRNPGSLLEEAKSFARQRPGAFLLLAAGAGILAGRLGKSLQAGAPTAAPTTGSSLPPQPVQSPATGSNISYGAGALVYGETSSAAPVYGETAYGEPARPGFDGPAGVPLRDPNDPFVQGEGSQL
jgi:hypothetical protein